LLWLDRLEDDFTQHFITRPLKANPGENPLGIISDRFARVRYWLTSDCGARAKTREALEHLASLMKVFTAELPGDAHGALRRVYDELREDWGEFWSGEDPEGIVAIKDDLDQLRGLEPRFAKEPSDVYKQFREILKSAGEFYAALPVLPSGRLTDRMRESLFNKASKLFSAIETLMAPKHFKFEEIRAEREKPKVLGIGEEF